MNKILLPLTAVALCFCTSQAMAAATTTGTGNANAKIISTITVTETQDLNFGTMIQGTAQNVTVSTAGARSCGQATKCVEDGTYHNGQFTVTNPNTDSVAANLSIDSTATLTGNTNHDTLTANTFTMTPTGSQTLTSGDTIVKTGATLEVTAAARADTYTGTYNVTVNY